MTCNCECHKPGHSMKHAQPCCGDAGDSVYDLPTYSEAERRYRERSAAAVPMSTCDQCGSRFPTTPIGVIHKCQCSGGMMVPAARAALSKATGEGASA